MQDAVGEYMAPLQITGELHFIDGHESHIGAARHGLNRADGIARAGRHDLFLTCDQRDIGRTNPFHDAVIDLARQKAQRQADHPASMRQHAFDGQMRFAGIGRPKHRSHIAATQGQRQIMGRELVHANNRVPGTSARHGLDAGSCDSTIRPAPEALLLSFNMDELPAFRRPIRIRSITCRLTIGTTLERIGDESLTRIASPFVHGNI